MNAFLKENKDFMENNIVKSFLQQEKNMSLFCDCICNSDNKSNKELDNKFKEFYFNIRFTTFVATTLYFNAVNFDKRYRKISKRHPLTVDKPIGGEEFTSFKDYIADDNATIKVENFLHSSQIEDYIEDPILNDAIKVVSEKQKEVINLAYVYGLNDTEISKILGKSQQAISKLHKKALETIIKYINKKGDNVYDCNGYAPMDHDSG